MSTETKDTKAQLRVLEHIIHYYLDCGLKNGGLTYLQMSAKQLATDLCTYNEATEGLEVEPLLPIVQGWLNRQGEMALRAAENHARLW